MTDPPSPADPLRVAQGEYSRIRAREGARLQHQILEAARQMGWRAIGTRPMRVGPRWRVGLAGDVSGWPDFLGWREDRGLLVRECKLASATSLSEAQAEWLRVLDGATISAGVWRGSDINDVIEELR